MANIFWIIVVAGGAAALGLALAFGMFTQDRKRSMAAVTGH